MTKQAGKLFRIDKRMPSQELAAFNPDDLTDHNKGEALVSPGDVGMFVREFRCPIDDRYRMLIEGEQGWVFEVYLFGDKLLQIEQYHASNILKPVKI